MDIAARKTLAENVKSLREHRGWSQTDLESRSGVRQTTISALERGVHGSSIDTISGLARAFNLPAWALLVPNLPADARDQNLLKVLAAYIQLPSTGRAELDRVAEAETRYHSLKA